MPELYPLPDCVQTKGKVLLMVLAGMVLSDWVSMIMCSCGHLASWHMLHPPPPGQTNPVLGSCKECKPFSHMEVRGCDGFAPRTKDDADKLMRALGIANPEMLEKMNAEAEEVRTKTAGIATNQQPMPHGVGREIFPLVQADLEERRQYGIRTYGEGLTAFNGRDALQDLYQELLDGVLFLRQMIEERSGGLKHNNWLSCCHGTPCCDSCAPECARPREAE